GRGLPSGAVTSGAPEAAHPRHVRTANQQSTWERNIRERSSRMEGETLGWRMKAGQKSNWFFSMTENEPNIHNNHRGSARARQWRFGEKHCHRPANQLSCPFATGFKLPARTGWNG